MYISTTTSLLGLVSALHGVRTLSGLVWDIYMKAAKLQLSNQSRGSSDRHYPLLATSKGSGCAVHHGVCKSDLDLLAN